MSCSNEKTKQPADVLYYLVKFDRWLADYEDDTIISASTFVNGVAIGSSGPGIYQPAGKTPEIVDAGLTAKIWLAGGVDNVEYTITCRITTAGGMTKDYDFLLLVEE
jgi:hypothetical protein